LGDKNKIDLLVLVYLVVKRFFEMDSNEQLNDLIKINEKSIENEIDYMCIYIHHFFLQKKIHLP